MSECGFCYDLGCCARCERGRHEAVAWSKMADGELPRDQWHCRRCESNEHSECAFTPLRQTTRHVPPKGWHSHGLGCDCGACTVIRKHMERFGSIMSDYQRVTDIETQVKNLDIGQGQIFSRLVVLERGMEARARWSSVKDAESKLENRLVECLQTHKGAIDKLENRAEKLEGQVDLYAKNAAGIASLDRLEKKVELLQRQMDGQKKHDDAARREKLAMAKIAAGVASLEDWGRTDATASAFASFGLTGSRAGGKTLDQLNARVRVLEGQLSDAREANVRLQAALNVVERQRDGFKYDRDRCFEQRDGFKNDRDRCFEQLEAIRSAFDTGKAAKT